MARLSAYVNEAVSDAANLFSRALDWTLNKGDVRIAVTSVADMVNQLIREARAQNGTYYKIVIQGHGGPGCQGCGDGVNTDKSGKKSLWVTKTVYARGETPKLEGDAERTLKPLADHLTGDCIVTLAGCSVGQAAAGELLLQLVSRALGGVAVQASYSDQMDFLPGMEGKIRRCTPNVCWDLKDGSWMDVPGSGRPDGDLS
jgi:hypothetical protein